MSNASKPFWEGCKLGEFRLQHCQSCKAYQHYPREVCMHCWSDELEWKIASGRASLHSYAIAVTPTHPSLVDKVPYVIALVDLEEGPRLATHVVNCAQDKLRIGMALKLSFADDLDPSKTLPVFEPVDAEL